MASKKLVFYFLCTLGSLLTLKVSGGDPPKVYVNLPEPPFAEYTWVYPSDQDKHASSPKIDTTMPVGPVLALVHDGVSRTIAAYGNHLIKIYDSQNNESPLDHVWIPGYGDAISGISIATSEPTLQEDALESNGTASNDYSVMGYLAHHCPEHDQSSLIYSGSLYKMTRRPIVFPLPKSYSTYSTYYVAAPQPLALPICRLPLLTRSFGPKNSPKLLANKDGSRFYFLDTYESALYIIFSDISTRNMDSVDDPQGPECAFQRVSLAGKSVTDLAIDRERDIVFVSRVDQNILALDGRTGKTVAGFSVSNRRPFGIQWDSSIQSLIVTFRFEDDLHRRYDGTIESPHHTGGKFNDMIAKVDLSGPVSEWYLASTKLQWIIFPKLSFIYGIQPQQEDGKLFVLIKTTRQYYEYKPDVSQYDYSASVGSYWLTLQWTDMASTSQKAQPERSPVESQELVYEIAPTYKQLSNITVEWQKSIVAAVQNPFSANASSEAKASLYQYELNEKGTILTRFVLAKEQPQPSSEPIADAVVSPSDSAQVEILTVRAIVEQESTIADAGQREMEEATSPAQESTIVPDEQAQIPSSLPTPVAVTPPSSQSEACEGSCDDQGVVPLEENNMVMSDSSVEIASNVNDPVPQSKEEPGAEADSSSNTKSVENE